MKLIDLLISAIYGIIEGITEWLPISSTGHLILAERVMPKWSAEYTEMFQVVIQLGAILAVVVLFFSKLWPLGRDENRAVYIKKPVMSMWGKIIICGIPAGIAGVFFDDAIENLFYGESAKTIVVATTLILYGIAFIFIERLNKKRTPTVTCMEELSYKQAFIIGLAQTLAIIPGTSRSGSTILGGMLLGTNRASAAEFSFYLAVPVMAGASALKLLKFGFSFTLMELAVLLVGMAVSFIVSMIAIRFLMNFVKKHDFKFFGYYRIALGIFVILNLL